MFETDYGRAPNPQEAGGPADPFFRLLETRCVQLMEAITKPDEYRTIVFDHSIYEAARGRTFSTREDAYRDWLTHGRRNGLPFADGRDTTLKIAVKVKNESALLDHWLRYHARIVGFHNLIVIDCGSDDPIFLHKLDAWSEHVVVLRYAQYYDDLHWEHANRPFYAMVSENSKYFALLDADEFLFRISDDNFISTSELIPLLRSSSDEILCCTWFLRVAHPKFDDNKELGWSKPLSFDFSNQSIFWGTFAGKGIYRSNIISEIGHVGHNHGTEKYERFLSASSFGNFGIFHVKDFDQAITRNRALQHLQAKGVVPAGVDNNTVADLLKEKLESGSLEPIEVQYSHEYLNGRTENRRPTDPRLFTSNLLGAALIEFQKDLCSSIQSFDFGSVMSKISKQWRKPRSESSSDHL